ncbi:response regulator [Aliibacillus thermotolerans]|uniref:Response regulator n=1 Tax=Aliibacillus thermotolerans TaxID=1834418 RepID=A0ABW0UAX5_9BACI|nr:response regulator transcription factor [Aliibacillus thermotolerans]MDA3128775.1 response regulator [Aliibacillus thermotolerans]
MNRGKVLVVDDEYKIVSLVKMYLEKNDYEVMSADTGKKALRIVGEQVPDLIVLDILLPDVNGLDLCNKIRLNNEIPIIYLSCLHESETIIKGLDNGGDDYLTKPFDPNVLVAKVNALLRRASGIYGTKIEQIFHIEPLTKQEKEILQWIEKGYTNKEIAEKLKLKEGTIKVYNHTIFQKLQVKNRTQAIVRAKEAKLL